MIPERSEGEGSVGSRETKKALLGYFLLKLRRIVPESVMNFRSGTSAPSGKVARKFRRNSMEFQDRFSETS